MAIPRWPASSESWFIPVRAKRKTTALQLSEIYLWEVTLWKNTPGTFISKELIGHIIVYHEKHGGVLHRVRAEIDDVKPSTGFCDIAELSLTGVKTRPGLGENEIDAEPFVLTIDVEGETLDDALVAVRLSKGVIRIRGTLLKYTFYPKDFFKSEPAS